MILGTPVWAKHLSSPVRTYITENNGKFNNVALFCTTGNQGHEETFKEIGDISGKKPKATLAVFAAEIKKDSNADKMKKFVSELKA